MAPEEDPSVPTPQSRFAARLDLLSRRPLVLYPVALALIAVIAAFDYWTGDEILLYVFHLFPVTLLAWGGGLYAGLAGAAVSAAAVLLTYMSAAGQFRTIHVWQAIVSFTTSAAVATAVAALRRGHDRILRLLNAERRLAREDALTTLA